MAAKMMRWRPWPPMPTRKFEVKLVLKGAEGVPEEGPTAAVAEVRWKGPKVALGSLRRTVKRNCTKGEEARDGGVVEWNEEFESVCSLTANNREGSSGAARFHPWEVEIRVFNGLKQGPKNKACIIGMASLNLADFASTAEEETELTLPLLLPGVTTESHPLLHVVVRLLELRTSQELIDTVKCLVPTPLSPPTADAISSEKDELSAIKAGLRKVKILTEFVSARKSKKTCREDEGSEGKCSAGSEDAEYMYPFDTDSLDDDIDEAEVEDGKEDSTIRKSFSYGTLATANCIGGSFYSDMKINGEYEDWVYYSHRRSDVGCSCAEEVASSVPEQSMSQTSKRSLLPWKKRKYSFRSPKAKGEPLLKKGNGDEGGDDIDYDRRQLSSSDESLSVARRKVGDDSIGNHTSISEFGDDNFAVGSWESKQVTSRDGHMKLSAQVFFASIDQRSERAAGEGACTALVAVIADWFQANLDAMPIKSQFDSLIREGSLEWRTLCHNPTYRECFPDKHFDLETVLQAKIRPLSVVPGKSFIGFFHPDCINEDNSGFDFLHGAMSFDSIWDEISQAGSQCPVDSSLIYIVSWNDHFFVLKVEHDAYYLIDTLGERLYEGCDQAYILRFDESTTIHKVSNEGKPASAEAEQNVAKEGSSSGVEDNGSSGNAATEEELVCRGKESCKEYIKSFLAAIPIRELQVDIKKGLMASTPLHHRLQIEFHYTNNQNEVAMAAILQPAEGFSVKEITMAPIFSPNEELAQEEAEEFSGREVFKAPTPPSAEEFSQNEAGMAAIFPRAENFSRQEARAASRALTVFSTVGSAVEVA